MRIAFYLALAVVLLLAPVSCGGGGGGTAGSGASDSGPMFITIMNGSSGPFSENKSIFHQRFYNYDTGELVERSEYMPQDTVRDFPLPSQGTWNVDVDFSGGAGPHGIAPSPPWVVLPGGGIVTFSRDS